MRKLLLTQGRKFLTVYRHKVLWKCIDKSHHNFVTEILCESKEDVRRIEKETTGQSTNKKWFNERKKKANIIQFWFCD